MATPEERKSRIKELFSETKEIKHDVDMLIEQRKGNLLQNAEFEKAYKKGQECREITRKIGFDFDTKHPQLIAQIEEKRKALKQKGETIAMLAIAMVAEGINPEVDIIVNGKKKKLKPSWKVSFKQQSLF